MITTRADVYKDALGILASSSSHIEHTAAFIKKEILPKLKSKCTMLDVGAGIGTMTAKFSDEFDEISVVDVNPAVKDDLQKQFKHVYIGDFLQYDPPCKYDFVLCSHVLYNLPREQLKAFIDKLKSLVAPGGYCLIELIAPRGRNHLFHHAHDPAYSNSSQVLSVLDEEKIPYQKHVMPPNHFRVTDGKQMHSLLKFFLFENCPAMKKSLEDPVATADLDKRIDEEVNLTQLPNESVYDYEQQDDAIVLHL